MPRVTVVIPAFNPGPFLDIAVASVLNQAFSDWEAIIVDDGSTEDFSRFTDLDSRLRIIRQGNRGLSAARNTAIEASGGEYIAFLDADDLWLPLKLACQVEALDVSGAGLCSTDFERVDEEGAWYGGGFRGCRENFRELLTGNGICVSTVMVSRAVLDDVGLFDLRFDQAQDWHLWLRIARKFPLVHVDEVLTQYRVHGSNMSRNYRRYLNESQRILYEHQRVDPSAVAEGLALVRRVGGAHAFDSFRKTKDLRDLWNALRFSPRLTLRQMGRFVVRH